MIRRIWKDHSLTILLVLFLVVVLVLGTWATWFEYVHNEQGGGGGHRFWSSTFLAYWSMQLLMNYAPELMGTITVVLLAGHFREKFMGHEDE